MARTLSPQIAADIQKGVLKTFIAVELHFSDTNIIRAWNGVGTIPINGNDYVGVGQFGSIGPVKETTDLKAEGMTFTLSGLPNTAISNALRQDYQRRPCSVYFGTLNERRQIVGDAYKIFGGLTDRMFIKRTGDTAAIAVRVESRLSDFQTPRETIYSDVDQQNRFPGDRGFEYIPSLQDREILWGRT